MLTVTETIEKPLDPTQKIALDNQKVCEAFIQAYEAGDRQTACEYAKVVMLKALSLWGFPQVKFSIASEVFHSFHNIVENSKS